MAAPEPDPDGQSPALPLLALPPRRRAGWSASGRTHPSTHAARRCCLLTAVSVQGPATEITAAPTVVERHSTISVRTTGGAIRLAITKPRRRPTAWIPVTGTCPSRSRTARSTCRRRWPPTCRTATTAFGQSTPGRSLQGQVDLPLQPVERGRRLRQLLPLKPWIHDHDPSGSRTLTSRAAPTSPQPPLHSSRARPAAGKRCSIAAHADGSEDSGSTSSYATPGRPGACPTRARCRSRPESADGLDQGVRSGVVVRLADVGMDIGGSSNSSTVWRARTADEQSTWSMARPCCRRCAPTARACSSPCGVSRRSMSWPPGCTSSVCACRSTSRVRRLTRAAYASGVVTCRARSSSRFRSCSLSVSVAARSNSARASSHRPSRSNRSPRTLGSRW